MKSRLLFILGVLHTAARGYPHIRISSWRELLDLLRWAGLDIVAILKRTHCRIFGHRDEFRCWVKCTWCGRMV